MESPALFLILTVMTFAGHIHSQSLHAINPTPVGNNLTITSDSTVQLGGWVYNGSIIVLIYPGGYVINGVNSSWHGRLIYNVTTSSLTIISTRLEDSGLYELQQINGWTVQLYLSVQVPISNVILSATKTSLVEFKDSVVLTCSVSAGTSLSFMWLEGNTTVSGGGGVQLSKGNTTLTITNVTRSNQGPFQCIVSNGLGNGTSPPVLLNISYGPDNTKISATPTRSMYASGSNITLLCTTDSNPPAMIQWMVNGVNLNQYGPQLNLENDTVINSGNIYTCVFYNTVTQRRSSASTVIQVMDPITSVVVMQTGAPAILDEPFTLSCEVTGPVDTIQWWKDGLLLSADNTTVFGNDTLTINPVQISDGGNYQCQAWNLVSNINSSSYAVQVNYGPETPVIRGPAVVKTGDNVTLWCWAKSVPHSLYEWYFNGSLVSNMSKYVTPPFTKEMREMFMCMAFNNVTGQNSSASFTPTVVDAIRSVQILKPPVPAVEGDPYELTCNVIGTVDYIYWMKNGEPLSADNMTASNVDNETLMFMPVERSDSGKYTCMAVDAAGNMTSDPYWLWVNFGPTTPIIYGPAFVETGSNAVFNCSAMSEPRSSFSWWVNGSIVSNTSQLNTGPLTLNMSGEYTCMAFNNVTGNSSTNSTMLTVIEAIESVMIYSNATPMNQQNFTLTCLVLGPYDTIYWLKNGTLLSNNTSNSSSLMYYFVDNMLYFSPLSMQSQGTFQCVATNEAANHMSPQYSLLVYYGPQNMSITGPGSGHVGVSVSLTCSADCQPACDFYWFFNNWSTPLRNGSVLTFTAAKSSAGMYICQAKYQMANTTMSLSKTFTVSSQPSPSPSGGAHFTIKGGLMFMGLCALTAHFLSL